MARRASGVLCAGCGVLAVAGSGLAQPAYRLEVRVSRALLEPGEVAVVELWAHFDPGVSAAMAEVRLDLVCTLGGDGWSDLERIGPPLGLPGPGEPGVIGAEGITGIVSGQPCGPGMATASPVAVWRGRYTAPDVGRVGTNRLTTRTGVYDTHGADCAAGPTSRLGVLAEGEAFIHLTHCRPDMDADGSLTVFDMLSFLSAFDRGDRIADFDDDGVLTLFDYLAFQNEFDAGC